VADGNDECRIRNDEPKTLRNSHFYIRTFRDAAVRQLVRKAITTDGQVINVFTAAGQLSANGAEPISPGQRPGIA
jgi:hypothetical protein